MLRLPDGARQVVAGLVAAGGFLALFFGLQLAWWVALVAALGLYGAALLLIERRRGLSEIQLTSRVSAADIDEARAILGDAQTRLGAAAEIAPPRDQPVLTGIADDLGVIRQNILDDPEDFRAARSFLRVHLPEIVRAVEGYAKLSRQATPETAARIDALGQQVRDLGAPIRAIRTASAENDLARLDIELSVLSDNLNRRRGSP